jgi:hypothetical protein
MQVVESAVTIHFELVTLYIIPNVFSELRLIPPLTEPLRLALTNNTGVIVGTIMNGHAVSGAPENGPAMT